jgi:polygalacturonase
MYYSSWKPFSTSEARTLFPDTLLFKGDFSNAAFQRGDILTIRDPYRDNCGAFINLSKNVVLENIKMHYMHGMGIVSQFSENITIKNVEVAPREETNRVIAAFADCFHFSGCKGLVILDSCRTSGSHDDPVNVHGTHLKIVKIEQGNNLRVRFMHHQTYGFKAFFSGDSIAFVKPENLLVYDTGVVKSAKLTSKREMLLEIEGDLPASLESGHCLENITWTPEVIVRNCRFQRTNTRGLLVTTRRSVLIENNTFYRTGMHAILIANDCNFWYESGPVKNVTIRGNAFIQCGYNKAPESYVIAIQPETHNFIENRYIHSNIRIENNSFDCIAGPVLSARSVRNLDFKNNVIHFKPMQNAAEESSAFIVLEHCSGVRIPNNEVSGFTEQRLILIDKTDPPVRRDSQE